MRRLQDLGTKLYKDSPQVKFPEFKINQISKASTEVSQSQGRHRLWSDKDINMSSCLPRMAPCHVPLNKTAIQNAGNTLLFVVSKTVNNECCTRDIFR